ncbi:MAG: oxygen-independent coproporphyrinogen III oxidase [Neomegalonema sp.]|nr:oxygen-independent coproporphyrinogen III oxidase [Neomegalonema sp.]
MPTPSASRQMTAQAAPHAKYLTQSAPRYTSYPTAPHFGAAVDAEIYRGWLRALPADEPISLYLHVPFCRQLCWYCGCNMKLATRDAPISAYIRSLLAEIDLLSDALPARMRVSHLHWGGGTPTAMAPEDLAQVMGRLRELFDFTDDAEIAIEGDPRTMTAAMIERIGALGFTRASFGVQEFDPQVQKAINRVQPPEMVAECVAQLRAAGVSGVNFDLIYGLPHQTAAKLARTVALCAEIRPDRVALFGYAHVPWMAKKQRLIDEAALPGAAARLEQAETAAAAFRAVGYEPVGLDHFALAEDPLAAAARSGRLRRNFQGYTVDAAEALIGLGATSIGRTPSGYLQNIAETGAWARAVAAGVLPVGKGVAFDGEDRLRGWAIEQVMCFGAVDLGEAAARFGAAPDWWRLEREKLDELAADGLIEIDGDQVRTTEAGRPLVRVVAACFDQYLARAAARHSAAV